MGDKDLLYIRAVSQPNGLLAVEIVDMVYDTDGGGGVLEKHMTLMVGGDNGGVSDLGKDNPV
ncbi:unnamed protein product [Sphenostylis stenocarpa]|uniref:Uncharacterized protein n=1 Tax=Sphenostylis stenocarpa TaxID=92480 RepID=A0AA86VKV1_9FABA|nr:unnamed protein product [Sphenostylis stenocarpa]